MICEGHRDSRDEALGAQERWLLRAERVCVPDGSGIASAIDYHPNRWTPLRCFLEEGDVS
jgi:hypothetical protein